MEHEHYCQDSSSFPITKFLQEGAGKGRELLVVGEAPAQNGWRKSGRAFYTIEGKLLPTGKNLNSLLEPYQMTVETVAFTELIKCYAGTERAHLTTCGQKCWPIFLKQLEQLSPRLVLLLGIKSLEIFNKNAGTQLDVGKVGEADLIGKQYKVLPIYHPSPIGPLNKRKNEEIFGKLSIEIHTILN